jgi:glycosyltransferase involved in cell wall biosynthesis
MHVALVGTYPPTECGIATFTADVERALKLHGVQVTIVPVERGIRPAGGPLAIWRDNAESYADAALRMNAQRCDVVLIEHEFGIFGGDAGAHLLGFTDALTVPFVVTLHTVLPCFHPLEAEVIERLVERAAAVTLFTGTARSLLVEQGLARAYEVQVVPHGAPVELYATTDNAALRERLGLPATGPVLSTFGLLSAGKGIELALSALAEVVVDHPDVRYVVAGRTHPQVIRNEGESYRESLTKRTQELGLESNVIFLDHFLSLEDLAGLLSVTDVFCTPYRGENQIVSGALTFALAAGCPVVSTPYSYATDVLAGDAGILVEFGDTAGFAEAIQELLVDGPRREAALAAANEVSASLSWPTVGKTIRAVLTAASLRKVKPMVTIELPNTAALEQRPRPDHLRVLCDDTSMLQHAFLKVPRAEDGYCVDDVARMLPIAADLFASTGDPAWNVTISRLLTFLRAATAADGLMRNFMSWDRRWLDEPHEGDHVGRAMWGLGELAGRDHPYSDEARFMLVALAPALQTEQSNRTMTYAALGLCAADAGRDEALHATFEHVVTTLRTWLPGGDPAWCWPEARLTYDNARVPEVLIRTGIAAGDTELIDRGSAMLTWFDALCLSGDHYRFPGHLGVDKHRPVRWSGDEQPLEATAMADAHAALWSLDNDAAHGVAIDRAWSWFLGNNRLGRAVGDVTVGACFDGLERLTVNLNCGAESTIAFHRCAHLRHSLLGKPLATPRLGATARS